MWEFRDGAGRCLLYTCHYQVASVLAEKYNKINERQENCTPPGSVILEVSGSNRVMYCTVDVVYNITAIIKIS